MENASKTVDEGLDDALASFLSAFQTTPERVAAVEAALLSPAAPLWRGEFASRVLSFVPVEALVPDAYREWRPVVADAMRFVVLHLSAPRLAPKVVEQLELPRETPAEIRLLRLIAKVPGLQKIGQVLARNRHLLPRFRRALAQLENGISDVGIEQMREIVLHELGPRVHTYAVRIEPAILSEASVSAVIRFTWRNPATRRREPGVFKILKPHIPGSFAEDMAILQKLPGFLARKYRRNQSRYAGLAETLTEIRLLLAHEVDFRREQLTLARALEEYSSAPGVRVPRLIQPLCTPVITAMTREPGVKITRAFRGSDPRRVAVAERLAQTLIAIPAFSRQEETVMHADPHAGNLLYDRKRGDLVVLDWALAERLTRRQRRDLMLLTLMIALRDASGAAAAVERLRLHRPAGDREQARMVRREAIRFLDELPLLRLPGPMDAMRFLDALAMEGVRFPPPLVMFRKATFTLDGVLEDITGSSVELDTVLARYAAARPLATSATLFSLLSPADWLALNWSVLTFAPRILTRAALSALQAIAAEPISGCIRTNLTSRPA